MKNLCSFNFQKTLSNPSVKYQLGDTDFKQLLYRLKERALVWLHCHAPAPAGFSCQDVAYPSGMYGIRALEDAHPGENEPWAQAGLLHEVTVFTQSRDT